jgi:hypothetical protein|tara:strand:- start:1654 stop:2016 length:363 start_codon:yes stop_codon:yes gene_type:complete
MLPVQRTYTGTPVALNSPVFMIDNQTGISSFLTLTPNTLQDLVNNPDPAAGLQYQFTLVKNGNSTSVRAFSNAVSPLTSGRVPIGVVSMSSGSYQWQCTQQGAGAATPTTILVRYGSPLN